MIFLRSVICHLFLLCAAILVMGGCVSINTKPDIAADVIINNTEPKSQISIADIYSSETTEASIEGEKKIISSKTPYSLIDINNRTARQFELNKDQEATVFIKKTIASMNLKQKIGQMIMPSFASEPDKKEAELLLSRINPGGIILFGKDIITVEQTVDLIRGLQGKSNLPLFIAADQEGGVVSRLNESGNITDTIFPSQRDIGDTGFPENAYLFGKIMGSELSGLGINMNMAPVADIDPNPSNTAICLESRSFGNDKFLVADMVFNEVKGLQSQNVSAVVKHFPGHGDARSDSHEGAVSIAHNLNRLRDVEFFPFKRGILAGTDGIMIGHINLPTVLGNGEPATFSKYLLEEILREELGFENLIITDALEMGALTKYYTQKEIIVKSVNAGVDILLKPDDPHKTFDILMNAVINGEISESKIDESVERILKIKYKRKLFEDREAENHEFIVKNVKMKIDEHINTISTIMDQDLQRPFEKSISSE
jgi:beta-N-acetylhexosaminidase